MSRRVPAAMAAAGLALLVTAAPAAAQTPPAPTTGPNPAATTPLPRPRPPEPQVIPSVLGPRGEILFPDPMRIVPDAVKMIFDNDDEEAAQQAEASDDAVERKKAVEVAKPATTAAGEA